MKLEIKHLAPYLPYGLHLSFPIYNTILIMTSLSLIYVNREFECRHIKPILRPLSDLTKEIEVNGEKFVPNNNPMLKYYIAYELNEVIANPLSLSFKQISLLLEWHFDIFGLIDKNLAININDNR